MIELSKEVQEALKLSDDDRAWAERCIATSVEHPKQYNAVQVLAKAVRDLAESLGDAEKLIEFWSTRALDLGQKNLISALEKENESLREKLSDYEYEMAVSLDDAFDTVRSLREKLKMVGKKHWCNRLENGDDCDVCDTIRGSNQEVK